MAEAMNITSSIFRHRVKAVEDTDLYGPHARNREVASASRESFSFIASPIVRYPYKEEVIARKSKCVVPYTQNQLWEGDPPKRVVAEKVDDKVMPISWIRSIAEGLQELNVAEYNVTVDERAPGFKDLNDWLERTYMRADGSFVYKGIPNASDRLPALWTETESGNGFRSSINKTARGVIAQLRCLRCYSDTIEQCKGFMFPSSKQASMVVMVNVQWQQLTMVVELEFLNCVDVREHVVRALTLMNNNRAKLLDTRRGNYFVRLSTADLRLIVCDVNEFAVQIPSKHSILVETTETIIKIPPTYSEFYSLDQMHLLKDSGNIDRLCLPHAKVKVPKNNPKVLAFIFSKVHYQPMNVDEASQCMKSFAETVTKAIQQLHGHGFVHADIRLPNICFNERFEAVLIDLDRSMQRDKVTAGTDWHDFGSILTSLTGSHVQAWKDFVKRIQEGHEPDINVLGKVPDQDTVEIVLRRRTISTVS